VIVIAGRPQQAVHAGGGDGLQPPCGAFLYTADITVVFVQVTLHSSIDSPL